MGLVLADSPVFGSPVRVNRCDETVEFLTELILENHLGPGDYLPAEPELCKRLNVSRATLREAFRVLEARGLIERRHGVGILVSNRSLEVASQSISMMLRREPTTVRDLFEVRLGLECQSAILAAQRATEAGIDSVAEALEMMREEASTVDQRVTADVEFHLRLAECTGNASLVMLISLIRVPLFDSMRATYSSDLHTERGIPNHERVLDAVRRHDPDAAFEAMHHHMKCIEEKLQRLGFFNDDAVSDFAKKTAD